MADDQAMIDHGYTEGSTHLPSASLAQQQQSPPSAPTQTNQGQPLPSSQGGESAFRMTSLAAALPAALPAELPADPVQNYSHGQRYAMGTAGVMRNMSPYAPQSIQTHMNYQHYPSNAVQATSPVQYSPYLEQHSIPPGPYGPVQGQYGGTGMYGAPQPSPQYAGFPVGYGMSAHGQPHAYQGPVGMYQNHEYGQAGGAAAHGVPISTRLMYQPPTVDSRAGSSSRGNSAPSTPRGPPRKPKQSGHALWVGNLPPGTQVSELKDHFSRDATKEIESVFLISKSNCAFVNYKTEPACTAAMSRFHDSRFQSVRLVCRLRKGPGSIVSSVGPNASAPVGPAALQVGSTQSQSAVDAISQNRESSAKAMETVSGGEKPVNDKYFVVKSLTVEDLELSVRNGIWATQGHNEDALDKAYHTVENVFLIFSANKSGEYFGFARMESPINDETAKDLEWKPFGETRQVDGAADPELPRSIPTPATEFAPKGRIIDDSARGTIFWEADTDDDDQSSLAGESPERKEADADGLDEVEERVKTVPDADTANTLDIDQQTFGRPFRVHWVSTARLPFYRTRGLRNPWNANREVKIARDGTELETSVGRRLIAMFHRVPVMQQMQVPAMPGHQAYMGPMPQMGYGTGPMSPRRY